MKPKYKHTLKKDDIIEIEMIRTLNAEQRRVVLKPHASKLLHLAQGRTRKERRIKIMFTLSTRSDVFLCVRFYGNIKEKRNTSGRTMKCLKRKILQQERERKHFLSGSFRLRLKWVQISQTDRFTQSRSA